MKLFKKLSWLVVFLILTSGVMAADGDPVLLPGSSDITTVGTISSGVWNGTAIGDAYISSAATWSAKQDVVNYMVTGVASPTAGYVVKWGVSGNSVVDAFKFGTLTDTNLCTYTTANGLQCATAANTYQTALTYPVTGIASPTASYLTKWGASGNTLADAFKYGTLTDTKYCTYSTANGLECNSTIAGGGNVSNSGTPTNHQWAVFSDATTLKGVSVTASKVACSNADGDPVACTNLTDAVIPTLPTKASATELTAGTDDAKFATALGLRDSQYGRWIRTTGTFTATPASTSTLTMGTDLTATILVGMPIKYKISATYYYGVVTAMASNLLTVGGAPFSGDVTELYYGDAIRVAQVVVGVPSTYEDASNTALLTSDTKMPFTWWKSKAYLVQYKVWSRIHDSGAHGQVSVRINDTEVNTTAGGLTIAADATVYSTIVDIAVAAYDVNRGEAIEVTAVKGGSGDAADLAVTMLFVTP